MRSLTAKLSLAFLAILLVFGALGLWLAERGARAYFTEFTQRVNAPIAMYMASNRALVAEGRLDRDALAALADHVMMINPSVEVYLLDPEGTVIAQASTANLIARPRVALEPVKAFIDTGRDPSAHRPLLGDNPMDPTERRAFSAHPLLDDGRLVGYVYAVLAGRPHETLLASIRASHSVRTLFALLGFALLLAAVAGCVIFFSLTRRLHTLTQRVHEWQRSEEAHSQEAGLALPEPSPRLDEIDRLAFAHDTLRQRLHEQYAKLAERDRSRRELFAGISHDLRTPLTTLEGYLETLLLGREHIDPETTHQYLQIAHRQSQRLHRLLGELFELSRLDAGERELIREPFPLLELAHDAMQDIAVNAERRGIELCVIPSRIADRSLDVDADIALVQRVFGNLLDNALRYTPDGGHIGISVERVGNDEVWTSVWDDGCGMCEEDTLRVFEPRFSPDEKARRDEGHAGLGLAIVERIITLHGGRIGAHSRLGEGSVFTFALPVAATDVAPGRLPEPSRREARVFPPGKMRSGENNPARHGWLGHQG